jgi:ornithine decarboxylase
MIKCKKVFDFIRRAKPENPVYIYRRDAIAKATIFFLKNFKGSVLFAVKANSSGLVLRDLIKLGINKFDVASLQEVVKVKNIFPEAKLFFMHPVKSREAIRKSYFNYGVRDFVIDSVYELKKITEEIYPENDIRLYVRFSVTNNYSLLKLTDKFGVDEKEAIFLLKKCSEFSKNLGLCCHVGSQCMDPEAYRIAIRTSASIMKQVKKTISVLDIGGGFPSAYPNLTTKYLMNYFDAIHDELSKNNLNCELLCEPGRALVAESGAIVVKVELRKGNSLYINDGRYGNLFDADGQLYMLPVRAFRIDGALSNENDNFSFFGPTCDSYDFMQGPFLLPKDIREEDYIEIGQTGAYGTTLSTKFNGFGSAVPFDVFSTDESPILSMYN